MDILIFCVVCEFLSGKECGCPKAVGSSHTVTDTVTCQSGLLRLHPPFRDLKPYREAQLRKEGNHSTNHNTVL